MCLESHYRPNWLICISSQIYIHLIRIKMLYSFNRRRDISDLSEIITNKKRRRRGTRAKTEGDDEKKIELLLMVPFSSSSSSPSARLSEIARVHRTFSPVRHTALNGNTSFKKRISSHTYFLFSNVCISRKNYTCLFLSFTDFFFPFSVSLVQAQRVRFFFYTHSGQERREKRIHSFVFVSC